MDELKAQAKALGITIDARWSEATLRQKIEDAQPTEPAPPAMFPVRLLKHYKPEGRYEIVGEMAPAPRPGLDFPGKIWAGTVVLLERDEAVSLIENIVSEAVAVIDDAGKVVRRADGTQVSRMASRPFPLAERADAYPV